MDDKIELIEKDNNLTDKEKLLLTAFIRTLNDFGKNFAYSILFEDKKDGDGIFCVYKKDGKWMFHIVENNQISKYGEYDNISSLVNDVLVDIFPFEENNKKLVKK